MKIIRLLAITFFALASLPGADAGCLTLLHAGKCSASGPPPINTPTIIPLAGSYFNESSPNGNTNVALRLNGNTFPGALKHPNPTTNSLTIYVEGQINPAISSTETIMGLGTNTLLALTVSSPSTGLPSFFAQRGNAFNNWWVAAGSNIVQTGTTATAGTNYALGYYPFTSTGGDCQRQSGGIWSGGTTTIAITDPGFNCGGSQSATALSMPGDGAQQSTGAGAVTTTCVSNSPVTGEMTVTARVAIAHGILAGQPYTMQGFTPTGYNATYTSIAPAGTAATTLIGETTTGGGTCPAVVSAEGTALGGTGSTITPPAILTTAPWPTGPTGITAVAGKHFCGIIGEYGGESGSNFPGAQFASFVDDKGNPLPGAPALVPNLNEGTANWTGTLTNGSAVMAATANSYTITGTPSYTAASGAVLAKMTLTVTASPGFLPGSEFTVSGVNSTGAGVNLTYVADSSTTQSSTTITGIPLTGGVYGTGVLGTPAILAPPGTITLGGSPQITSVIMPGMIVLGSTPSATIGPFLPSQTGKGGTGNYQLTASQTASLGPSLMFGYPGNYYTAVAGGPGGGTVSVKSQATLSDFWTIVGSPTAIANHVFGSWGGSLANLSMLIGQFPMATASSDPGELFGAPSTSALASLCTKTTDIQSFATANGLTVQSLNHLNPAEGWADSALWTGTGYIDTASGSTATFHASTTQYGSAPTTGIICGPGIPGSPLACPTLSGTTLTWARAIAGNVGSVGSPIQMTAGNFKPALPLSNNLFTGYIDGDGITTIPTLHVTSVPTAAKATFTGTLGNTLAGSQTLTTLTVTTSPATGNNYPGIGPGTTIIVPGGTNETVASQLTITGSVWGATGTYQVSVSQTVAAATAMFATGAIPSTATSLMVTGVAGTIVGGMVVTDGGVSVTGQPILVQGGGPAVGGNATWIILPTYLPTFSGDATMSGTYGVLTPGQYIQTTTTPGVGVPSITTPVRITGYGVGFDPTIYPQNYLLSNAASNGVGSLGSPVQINGTGIADAGNVSVGTALTIRDQGPGVIFPAFGTCTAFGTCIGSATVTVSGTFDTSILGGMPAPALQGSISLTPNGPPISGCSACAWINLTGYTATLSSGTIWNWSGTLVNIPPSPAPVFVSVRAANDSRISAGTAYATMPSQIKIGVSAELEGEGEVGAFFGNQSGVAYSYFPGLWGVNNWIGQNNQGGFYIGPPITGAFNVSNSLTTAGDQFGLSLGCSTCAFSEASNVYSQALSSALGGWPVVLENFTRDGIGSAPKTFGTNPQIQTVGVGDGSTLSWCSAAIYCGASSSPAAIVSPSGPLYFSGALLTGASLVNVSVSGTTLTIPLGNQRFNTLSTNGLVSGAVAPGMILGITGSPLLDHCLTGCTFASNPANPGTTFSPVQTWALNCSGPCTAGTYGTTTAPVRVEPASGPAPWSAYYWQGVAGLSQGLGVTRVTQMVKVGTFQVTVNGTVACQDTSSFAWNSLGGNCTGANIASSFVNYYTGDYKITFTAGHAPASGAAIIGSYTNIMSPSNPTGSLLTIRPVNSDFFGDGTPTSGQMSSVMAKTPEGISLHIDGGDIADDSIFSTSGYPVGAAALTQYRSWYFGTRFPTIPGQSASAPVMSIQTWRGEGVVDFNFNQGGGALGANLFGQWGIDFATKSSFSGSLASTTLTLSGTATGAMWEGEVLDCVTAGGGCPLGASSGVYITALLTGSWGASGSTYSVVNPNSLATTGNQPLQNALYYTGGGPAYFSGPIHDVPVQGSPALVSGYAPHMANGPFGGRRVAQRWAAQDWAAIAGDPTLASDSTLSRASGSTACPSGPSPCFDSSATYKTVATPMAVSGVNLTFNGLTAHTIPIRVGANVTCSGCAAGTFVISVDHPPAQDTRAGQGQIGSLNNGFIVQLNQAPGASGVPFTFGCTGTSGSNCINFVFKAGTTTGTYTTPFALATCGENNLNGTAPLARPPSGICQSNGIGSLVRTFRIGTAQNMWNAVGGSPYDDGADPGISPAPFNQGAAFTCNIVDTVVVQCMKGAAYNTSTHLLTGIGKWSSGSTFTEYGDAALGTSRAQSVMGYVGGQPFPFTAGSGASASTSTIVQDTTCATGTGSVRPKMDVTTTNGGGIVNVYPSSTAVTQAMGVAIGAGCTFATPGTGGSGTVTPPVYNPIDGVGGVGTYNTDSNMMGDLLYGNEGAVGNPLNGFFSDGFAPGLPVTPFGGFMGAQVSG
jgi:hypothetical protein